MATFTVKADTKENRLYITIKGVFAMSEMQSYRNALKTECSKLKKGFTSVQDLREFTVVDPEVAKESEENKKICEQYGLGKTAMIVSSIILKGQMNRSYNNEGTTVKFFDNMDDALKYVNA